MKSKWVCLVTLCFHMEESSKMFFSPLLMHLEDAQNIGPEAPGDLGLTDLK